MIFAISLLFIYYTGFLLWIKNGIQKVKNKSRQFSRFEPVVSIIIPYRNENENLPQLLQSLQNQSYPKEKFEIIFVNDNSNDNSEEVINRHGGTLQIKILHLAVHTPSKKEAITLGVNSAVGEIIMGTDADCVHSPDWIRSHINAYEENTALVTGPVTYMQGGSLFNKIQELELMGLSLCGGGLIGNKHPVICSGANISYRKNIFLEVGGFSSGNGLTSGDDELLMHKMYYGAGYEIEFVLSPSALVKTQANKTIGRFLQQRRRWASKGPYYRPQTVLMLLPLLIFFILLLIGLPWQLLIMNIPGLGILTGLFILKIAVDFLVLREGVGYYISGISIKDVIAAEFLHPVYVVYSVLMGVFFGFTWKDREHKK